MKIPVKTIAYKKSGSSLKRETVEKLAELLRTLFFIPTNVEAQADKTGVVYENQQDLESAFFDTYGDELEMHRNDMEDVAKDIIKFFDTGQVTRLCFFGPRKLERINQFIHNTKE